MCGIAGILTFNSSSVPLENIRLMTARMKHRGPDDEGLSFFGAKSDGIDIFGGPDTPASVYDSPIKYCPRRRFTGQSTHYTSLALGHRRLSILDLSPAGHQPMSTEDGRLWIVFNGEIYNYMDIRQRLKNNGERFISHTDTEVILKAYRRWGKDCLNLLNGMWAFAIWDQSEQQLFCSRDRIGIKPFYYFLTERYFIFASDIKTLIASQLYRPEPDWEGIYHTMSLHCAPRPMTCFKGIRALEQGHSMKIDRQGRFRKERYWQMPLGEIDSSKTESQWVEELIDTLRKAVKRRLVADVQVGTFMSGGIDSTTISALAAQEQPGIKAFTLGYESTESELDELPQARATAKMWPMDHVIKIVHPETVLQNINDMVRCYEEPYHSMAPNYVISQFVAENNISVVLNGLGGDELFCGYGRERILSLWKLLRPFKHLIHAPAKWLGQYIDRINTLANLSTVSDISEVYLTAFSPFSEQEKRSLLNFNSTFNTFKRFRELYDLDGICFHDDIEALCFMEIINYIGNHHVYRVDQFTMHFSIESRFPFLDHELVELTCHMPSRVKTNYGTGKYILKKAVENLIHPSCLSMKKKGFSLPMKIWMHTKMKPIVIKKLERLKKRDIFNARCVDNLIKGFFNNTEPYQKLFFLVSFELWMEQFIDSSRTEI